MKKLLLIFMAAFAGIYFASCSEDDDGDSSPSSQPSKATSTTEAYISSVEDYFVASLVKNPGYLSVPEVEDATFVWERSSGDSNTWTTIEGQTEAYYKYNEETDKSKKIRVTITCGGKTYKKETAPILGKLAEADVSYTGGTLTTEQKLNSSTMLSNASAKCDGQTVANVTAQFVDLEGDSSEGETIIFALPYENNLSESGNIPILVTAPGYLGKYVLKYVTVKQVLSDYEMPKLSTDTVSIQSGCVKFEQILGEFEYSLSSDGSWSDDFDSPIAGLSQGSVIQVRKAAFGQAGKEGYLEASEPKSITVNKENIGTYVPENDSESYSPAENTMNNDDIDIIEERSEKKLLLKAQLKNPNVSDWKYTWTVDGTTLERDNEDLFFSETAGCQLVTFDSDEDDSAITIDLDDPFWDPDGIYTVTVRAEEKSSDSGNPLLYFTSYDFSVNAE